MCTPPSAGPLLWQTLRIADGNSMHWTLFITGENYTGTRKTGLRFSAFFAHDISLIADEEIISTNEYAKRRCHWKWKEPVPLAASILHGED